MKIDLTAEEANLVKLALTERELFKPDNAALETMGNVVTKIESAEATAAKPKPKPGK